MKGYGLIVAIMFMTSLSVIAVAYGENEQPGTSSHTYYVDKYSISGNCSDENVGNLTEPLCTINAAVDKLQSFSSINIEIYVRKGTYSHQEDALEHGYWITTDAVNTIGNKLLISNYPGEEVVIDCMGSNIGFNLYGSGITVQGLEIINFSSYAIYMGDNFDYNSVSILENRIHGCADNSYSCSGISIVGKNGHVIRGNEIFDLMTNEGSEYSGIKMRSNNAIIEKNTVYDNRNNGIRVIGKNNTIRENKIYNHFSGSNPKGIYASGERNTIHNNTLFENRYNINIASCEECTVSGNMVYSTFNQIGNGILVTNSIRARVLQNTITNIPGYGIKVHEWTHSFELKNNIIYNTGQNAIYIESQSVTGAAFESDYNLFHSFQQRPIYFMGREYGNGTDYTFDHYMDESGQDRNSIFQENPLFINENVFDFYPRVESPVCNMSSEGSHIGALPCKGQDTSADEEPTPSVPPCNPDWDCLD